MSSQLVFLVTPQEELKDGFRFLRACVLKCFAGGDFPLSVMGSYGLSLDLTDVRELAMARASADWWMTQANAVHCFIDNGIDVEMRSTLEKAKRLKLPIKFRRVVGAAPGNESMHFAGIAHDEKDCAICLGPQRVAELKAERGKLTVEELETLSHLPQKKE